MTVDSRRGQWTIAAKHTSGDAVVNVLLAFRPAHPPRTRRLYGFRRTSAGWVQVAGGHGYWVAPALRDLMREPETWPITHTALLPLLGTAAELPDHPATSEASK
jgi:hypothetical protein